MISCTRENQYFPRRLCLGLALGVTLGLSGCKTPLGGSGGGSTPPTPDPNHIYSTGNWQIQATATTGIAPFVSIAGFINESGTDPGINDLTTAAFQAESNTCYTSTPTIPLQGAVLGYQLGLRSFNVDGQIVTISAAEDATVTHLTGTYSVAGGCADKATGTLNGERYSPLTGVYKGSFVSATAPETVQLSLSQFGQGTGNGVFLVSGSGMFTGVPCFNQATLASSDGGVVGSTVNLSLVTNDPTNARLEVKGTITPDAKTFTIASATIMGGSCAGPLGGAGLTQQ